MNPNNVAVTLVFLLSLSLPSLRFSGENTAILAVRGLGIAAALYLFVLTNSRAPWLGCAVAAGALVLTMRTLSAPALVVAALAGAIYFLNAKGLELSLHDVIWEELLKETLRSSPWLGYGINYTKELLPVTTYRFKPATTFCLNSWSPAVWSGLAS